MSATTPGCGSTTDAAKRFAETAVEHVPTLRKVEAVLEKHRAIEGYFGLDLYRNYACSCGWWSTADRGQDHRAHVAAALMEAGLL